MAGGRIAPALIGTAIVVAWLTAVGSAPVGAADAPKLSAAPYKPLPIGTKIRFNDRSYEVSRVDGPLTVFRTRTEGERGWLRRSTRKEEWLKTYSLFGEFGDNMHVFDSRGSQIEYSLDSDEKEKLQAFWPLKTGNTVTFELEEGAGECTDADEWEISLSVSKTEFLTIGEYTYPTYVIEEKGESESGKIYKGTRWYQPDAGIIVKSEREWVKSFSLQPAAAAMMAVGAGMGGGFANMFSGMNEACMGTSDLKEPQFGEGERDDYALVNATYPAGTTTLALNRAKVGAESEAVVAEVRRLKEEIQNVQVARKTSDAPAPVTVEGLEGVEFGRYFALVIGVGNYKHMAKLATAVSDADAVATVLGQDYGFKVTKLIDPDRATILDELDELRETLGAKDNLLVYYSGRGWLDEDADRGYWLPTNAKTNRRSGWVSNADITDTLKTLQAKHVLVVADSCYSGTLTRDASPDLRSGDYLKRMAGKWARVAITSGGLEPTPGKDNHSTFARAFIDVLAENESIIDGARVFGKMRRPLMVASDRTPRYADVRNAGHDGGDFLFVRRK